MNTRSALSPPSIAAENASLVQVPAVDGNEKNAVVTTPVAPAPAAKLDEDTAKVLLDLALRRHDNIEKAYDTMNLRIAGVLGFSSLLATAFFKALDLLPGPTSNGDGLNAKLVFSGMFMAAFIWLAWHCLTALQTKPWTFLDTGLLATDFFQKDAHSLRGRVIKQLKEIHPGNQATYEEKALKFKHAVWIVMGQIVVTFSAISWAVLSKFWK